MKPLAISAHGVRFSPKQWMSVETMRSEAPLSIMHIPMMEAMAINQAIFPATTPRELIGFSIASTH